MKIPKGSVWRCIDEDSEYNNKLCCVVEIQDNPDFNGDGTITLRYEGGDEHTGKVRRFTPGITHERVSGVTQAERKERISQLRLEYGKLDAEMKKLKADCDCMSSIKKVHDSAKCDVCGKDYGWWCPDSPNHVCDYEHKDKHGTYDDEDDCKYCHSPEERK